MTDIGIIKTKIEVDAGEAIRTVDELVERVRALNSAMFWLRTGWVAIGFSVVAILGFVVGRLA